MEINRKRAKKFFIGTVVAMAVIQISNWNNSYYAIKKDTASTQYLQVTTAKVITLTNNVNTIPQNVSRGGEINRRYSKDSTINAINKNLYGKLSNQGETFYLAGQLENVDSKLLTSISIHETRYQDKDGYWKAGLSPLLRDANNVAGINWTKDSLFPKLGRYNKYPSVEKSIYDLAERLQYYYIKQGLNRIDLIQKKFAPDNDYQQGVNGMDNTIWTREVTNIYNKICNDAEVN